MAAVLWFAEALFRLVLRLFGYRSKYVSTSAGRVHAFEIAGGTGPTLVVLHGIGASAASWWRVLLRLRKRFGRIIVPELPGHGLSEDPAGGLTPDALGAGITEALLELLDGKPAIFLGNSMGGAGAVRFAEAHPELVTALILNSPGGAMQPQDELQRFLNSFRLTDSASAAAFVDKLHAKPQWYSRFAAPGVRALFQRGPMAAFLDGIRTDHLIAPTTLSALPMPVALVWGGCDHLMWPAHRAFYEAHLPPSALRLAPDWMGHCSYLDEPVRLADLVIETAGQLAPNAAV